MKWTTTEEYIALLNEDTYDVTLLVKHDLIGKIALITETAQLLKKADDLSIEDKREILEVVERSAEDILKMFDAYTQYLDNASK